MIFPQRNKPRRSTTGTYAAIGLVTALLLAFIFLFPKATRVMFSALARPIWAASARVSRGAGITFGYFHTKSSLIAQVANLQTQVNTLTLKESDYDAIQKENQDLKAMYGRSVTANRILARVLSAPPQSPYDTVLLDGGSSDGIVLGDRVYISDTVVIGVITSVTAHTSLVELFSHGGAKHTLTLERTGAMYDVTGDGGLNMAIQAPKDADILWGDTFNLPDLQTSVVGKVYYIDTTSQSSFKTVYIKIPENVFQTEWVFVEKA